MAIVESTELLEQVVHQKVILALAVLTLSGSAARFMREMFASMSFESRRRLFREGGTRRAPVAVEVWEMVECMLRMTERTGSCMLMARE